MIVTMVVLECGRGNDDLDGNDGGVIDFNFCLMMMLEATGRKVEWSVAMTMMVLSNQHLTILFCDLMKVVMIVILSFQSFCRPSCSDV